LEHTLRQNRRIVNNTFFSLVARFTELGAGVVTVVLAARYLGIEQFGEYAFIRAIVFVVGPLISFALPRIMIRDISINKACAANLVTSGLFLNIVVGIIIWCFASIVSNYIFEASNYSSQALNVAILGNIFLAMLSTVCAVFVAYEKILFDVIASVISRTLTIIFFLAVAFWDLGLISFFYALVLANSIAFVSVLGILRFKFVRIKLCIDFKAVIYIVKEAYPIALSMVMIQGRNNVFVFFLKLFRETVEIALFQAPLRVIQQVLIVPRSFFLAYIPILSRMANDENKIANLQNAYEILLKYIFITTFPFCIYISLYATDAITMTIGNEFIEAADSLKILIWVLVLLCIDLLLSNILTSLKKQKILTISSGLCLTASCILGFMLVPKYGYIGATWSIIVSAAILVIVNFYYLNKYIGNIKFLSIIYRPLICSSCLIGLLILFSDTINGFLLLAIGSLFYFFLLCLFKAFTQQEIEIFRSIITNLKKSLTGKKNTI